MDAGWSIENIVFIVRPEGLELLTFWFEASRAHRALATVKPNCAGDSANKIRSECLVPRVPEGVGSINKNAFQSDQLCKAMIGHVRNLL